MSNEGFSRDRFKNNWNAFRGELQKKWTDFSDDDFVDAQGDYDKFLAVVQKRYKDRQEDVVRWTNDWYSKQEQEEIVSSKATESRNQR
jgi:uncharacterized protein YjbJ (UPF0337 family)